MEEECGNGYDFFDNGHYSYGINLEYGYDANGNVTMDVNKGIIGISYDHNNLPIDIDFSNDSKLQYLYDAAGNKLRQDVIQSKTLQKRTDFISNFVLINNYPYWLNFDEGRVILNRGEVTFTETHIKDHLGNTRLAIGRSDNALVVKQVNSFYPFGMNIKGLTTSYNMPVTKAYPPNEYLYNGKMFQDELGLDWLDYGWRMYDAVLGRWHSPDPLEQYESGYVYVGNNPISMNDPSGMWAENVQNEITSTYIDRKGKVLWHKDDGDNRVYLVTNTSSWVKGGMKKEGLSVVGYEDPSQNYRQGDQCNFYVPPSLLNAYRFYSLFENAINYWSDLLGGPEGNDVTTIEKLNFQLSVYAVGKIFVTIKNSKGSFRKEVAVPEGWKPVSGVKSKFNTPVFKKGNRYISPDVTEHNTVGWKMAKGRPENLWRKETRLGTYNENLTKKIGK